MRRVDEQGEQTLIQTVEPVNRYPDFVRHLVRQLKCLCPTMGYERMAQVLARVGLALGATTIRRIVRERSGPSDEDAHVTVRRRRRVVAKYPGHVSHIDLTTVPTRAGFWVPWFPFSLPQRWPFCWWVAVAVDQFSRAVVGFAVFPQLPISKQVQSFLDRAIRASGSKPKYVVCDKGKQFWCRSFKSWCKRRGVRRRCGMSSPCMRSGSTGNCRTWRSQERHRRKSTRTERERDDASSLDLAGPSDVIVARPVATSSGST
jgi:transposase InsO family protein